MTSLLGLRDTDTQERRMLIAIEATANSDFVIKTVLKAFGKLTYFEQKTKIVRER